MADFTNKQLAEIISQSSEEIHKSVLNQRKIANELIKIEHSFSYQINALETKIRQLEETSISPDLSQVNRFYEERTAENVNRLNSRLKVPNLSLYVWLSSVVLFFLSGIFIWSSVKTKQEIITTYHYELLKKKSIIPIERHQILLDMDEWFSENPNNKNAFIEWRNSKK